MLVGIAIAIYPFASVGLVSFTALNQLPETYVPASDDHRFAMFDDEFIVATRTYEFDDQSSYQAILSEWGFTRFDSRWRAKECCGAWDAVLVRTTVLPDGRLRADLTMYDTDVQSTWWAITLLGLMTVAGGRTLRSRRSQLGADSPNSASFSPSYSDSASGRASAAASISSTDSSVSSSVQSSS